MYRYNSTNEAHIQIYHRERADSAEEFTECGRYAGYMLRSATPPQGYRLCNHCTVSRSRSRGAPAVFPSGKPHGKWGRGLTREEHAHE